MSKKTQNFEKEKIQIQYTIQKPDFTEAKSVKDWGKLSEDLIKKLEKPDEWGFKFAIKKDKSECGYTIDRIMDIVYPRLHNGHKGEGSHKWQWQLDVTEKGAKSTDRLYIDKTKAEFTNLKVLKDKVKVGTDHYTVIEVKVQVSGDLSADQKH